MAAFSSLRTRSAVLLVAVVTAAAALSAAEPAQAAFGCRTDVALNVVAHEDDDILFMSPDIDADIAGGRCTVTTFVSAGDAGRGTAYWQGRELAARAATAHMAGVPDVWTRDVLTVAGHEVVQDTLDAKPSVGLVFLRVPDGALQGLWQSTTPSVTTVDAAHAYTRAGLVDTLLAIMNTYRPTLVRAQDYVGTFGDGDHRDHHASAYFTRAAHDRYKSPHRLTGYLGYPVASRPSNLTAAQAQAKLDTFLAYAPNDPNVCQTAAACLADVNMGPRYSRRYTVGSELGGVQNVARVARVTASSQSTTTLQTAAKAVNGVVAGFPGDSTQEWATVRGLAGSWLQLDWPSAHTLTSVALYDRPNLGDQVRSGTLLFGDGSSVRFGALPNDGSALVVTFPARRVSRVRVRVDSVASTTRNVGLAEVQAWTTNVAPQATVTASSQNTATKQTADRAVDGVAQGYPAAPTREWATVGGKAGSTLTLSWPVPVRADRVVLYDRPNTGDQVLAGTLTFDDGTVVAVPALPNTGTQLVVTFPARTVRSVVFRVTRVSSTTRNVGLAEIQVQNG